MMAASAIMSPPFMANQYAFLRYREIELTAPTPYQAQIPGEEERDPVLIGCAQVGGNKEQITVLRNFDNGKPIIERYCTFPGKALQYPLARSAAVYVGYPLTILQITETDDAGAALRTDIGAVYLDTPPDVKPVFVPLISWAGGPALKPAVKVSATCVLTEIAGYAHDHLNNQTHRQLAGKLLFYMKELPDHTWKWTFKPIQVVATPLRDICLSRDDDLLFVGYVVSDHNTEVACYSLPSLRLQWTTLASYLVPPRRDRFVGIPFVSLQCCERGHLLLSISDHPATDVYTILRMSIKLPHLNVKPNGLDVQTFYHFDPRTLHGVQPSHDGAHAISAKGDFVTMSSSVVPAMNDVAWFVTNMHAGATGAEMERLRKSRALFETHHQHPDWLSTSKVHYLHTLTSSTRPARVYFSGSTIVTCWENATGVNEWKPVSTWDLEDIPAKAGLYERPYHLGSVPREAVDELMARFGSDKKAIAVAEVRPGLTRTVLISTLLAGVLETGGANMEMWTNAQMPFHHSNDDLSVVPTLGQLRLITPPVARFVTAGRNCEYCKHTWTTMACGQCRGVAYCCVEHMSADYVRHSTECAGVITRFDQGVSTTADSAGAP